MKCTCKKCNKEFSITIPTFKGYILKGEEPICSNCIFKSVFSKIENTYNKKSST